MTILKQTTLPTGQTLGYHRATRIEANLEDSALTVVVDSWLDRVAYLASIKPVRTAVELTLDAFPAIEQTLVSSSGNPFSGGTLQVEGSSDLEKARVAKWAYVKAKRARALDAGLTTPYGVFQCKAEDRQNITDAIMLAQTLTGLGQPVSIPWTLADNSVVTLDLQQLVMVGLLLGQRVQSAHATARALRAQIEAAVGDELESIEWPPDQ